MFLSDLVYFELFVERTLFGCFGNGGIIILAVEGYKGYSSLVVFKLDRELDYLDFMTGLDIWKLSLIAMLPYTSPSLNSVLFLL